MPPSPLYPVSETSPGHYARPLEGFEKFFIYLREQGRDVTSNRGREHYFLCSVITLSSPKLDELVEKLQDSWVRMRWAQPWLAADADAETMTEVYEVPTTESLAAWVAATFHVESKGSSQDAFSDLPVAHGSTLTYFAHTGEVMLRTPHWLMDGRGTMRFWDAFLTDLSESTVTAASLDWGKETARLGPSIGDAIGCYSQATIPPEQQARLGVEVQRWGAGQGSPLHAPYTINQPTRPKYADLVLSPEETSTILKGSKKNGWTVSAAVHAAFVLANIALAESSTIPDGSPADKYTSIGVFDLRRHLAPELQGRFDTYNTPWPMSIPLASPPTTTRFSDLARAIHAYYANTFPGPKTDLSARAVAQENLKLVNAFHTMLDGIVSSPKARAAPPSPGPFTSALGVVDDYIKPSYGPFKVDNFHFAVDCALGSSCLFWYTFAGSLRMVFTYNESQWAEDVVRKLNKKTKEYLIAGLVGSI